MLLITGAAQGTSSVALHLSQTSPFREELSQLSGWELGGGPATPILMSFRQLLYLVTRQQESG